MWYYICSTALFANFSDRFCVDALEVMYWSVFTPKNFVDSTYAMETSLWIFSKLQDYGGW